MGKYAKIMALILSGTADANIPFDDLCTLLKKSGFDFRTRGSHYNFFKSGIEERINLQRDGNKAKQYQVRQVRNIIIKYNLGGGL
jgi:predicted RNA binding protein YcfA (HicA-like mRNA interferase family)